VASLNVHVTRVVRVEQLVTILARIIPRNVVILDVVNYVVFLGASLGTFQTLIQVGVNFLEAQIHEIQIPP